MILRPPRFTRTDTLLPGTTRCRSMLVAVSYAACATAAVGPVTFVAFVAGPIARNLLSGACKGFVQAARVGALVMLGSDLVAQHALPAVQLPVEIGSAHV